MSESESTRDRSRWTLDRKSLELDVRRTLDMPSRRLFNRRILTLGGLTMLTGCSLRCTTTRRSTRFSSGYRG